MRTFHLRQALVGVSVGVLLVGMAARAGAQTPFAPYYNKNDVHYDTFKWNVYETDHFQIYYYGDVQKQLERIAGYAESAYQQISADLRHELRFKVPLILFKTHSEFEQQNVASKEASSEGVAAFADSERRRMLMPIDEPTDRLYGLITHELTHIFDYDIIPQSLIRRSTPLWLNEGLADFERAQWDPLDLMTVRDAAVTDTIPKMTQLEGYGDTGNPRMVYNLGHAVFEFIESKFGREGVRNFLFALRKSVIGGGEDAYEEAFQMKPEEFDSAFERYLKERFKPFRDKERPADYGRDLAPDAERTPYSQALSIAPSPSGDLIATATGNRRDGEIDIILTSTKDGSVIANLTNGFDKDMGIDHIVQLGERFNTVPWMSWSPDGNRLAYFARTGKERSLIIQNVVSKKIVQRIPMKTVDEPESPAFSPDGRSIAFAGLRGGISDIYRVELDSGNVENLTNDDFGDYGPVYSPDGRYIIYIMRISGNHKLFRLDLDTKKQTQLTFAPQDETSAQFVNDHTIVFGSTATDPKQPLDPEVAKNGNIYNIWTLDLKTGDLRQFTDALGATLSPVVLDEGRIAFVTYYKGDWGVHSLERKAPIHSAASDDFGTPGPIVDFQSPLTHSFVPANMRQKKRFENMYLQGVPSVNIMVTNNGDLFGGTAITFGDILGDQHFVVYADSSAQYSATSRGFLFGWTDLSRRFQFTLQALAETRFFYGATGGVFYDPSIAPFFNREQLLATSTQRGGNMVGVYPLSRYRRIEMSAGLFYVREQYSNEALQSYIDANQVGPSQLFRDGNVLPLSAAFVQETTVFREYGPLSGSTMRLDLEVEPKLGNSLSSQTFDADARYYKRLATNGVFAVRLRAFKSGGDNPRHTYFGGNSEMRGYDYLAFVGENAMFANAELRFPIIQAALTPIGVVGGVRGVFFANAGGGWLRGQDFTFITTRDELVAPIIGYERDDSGNPIINPLTSGPVPIYGPTQLVSGLRFRDARASYGVGLETFALGFPIHFDWAWRTLMDKQWENIEFAQSGGSRWFRKPKFAVWVGYDF